MNSFLSRRCDYKYYNGEICDYEFSEWKFSYPKKSSKVKIVHKIKI